MAEADTLDRPAEDQQAPAAPASDMGQNQAPAGAEPIDPVELIAQQIMTMDDKAREALKERFSGVVQELAKKAQEQVDKKRIIERRWLDDLRQYHSRYTTETWEKLKKRGKSRVFANVTRPKTNAWAARLGDMLFPTDDKNWGVKPTPVPKLAGQMQDHQFYARQKTSEANRILAYQHPDPQVMQQNQAQADSLANQAADHAKAAGDIEFILDEAKTRAEAMENEINDHFVEADWSFKNRQSLLDEVKLGVGVLKGPLSKGPVRGSWRENTPGDWAYELQEDPRQDWQRVDPWSWFPDMNAHGYHDKEFDYERHLKNKKELRKLARTAGFLPDAINTVLNNNTPESVPDYLASLRDITGNNDIVLDKRYLLWEYTGPIESSELETIVTSILDPHEAASYIDELNQKDELSEYQVVIWFGYNEIIKFAPHPLDSGESIYSSCPFVEDETSPFGFGIPYLMRNSQAIINGAWRMVMDNGGVSAGPQVVVNRNIVDPADGVERITGLKLWTIQNGKTLAPNSPEPFKVYNIENNQEMLMEVIKLALEFIDLEVSLPLIAQGEQGEHQETQGGRSLLMNSANVMFRWAVKNWDDRITRPCVTRSYDWLMQHSPKASIKGDMKVDARGSSVLLERTTQGQNLAAMIKDYSGNPQLGPMMKVKEAFRKLVQCYGISPDDIIKSDAEIQQQEQAAASQPKPPTPEESRVKVAEIQAASAKEVELIKRDTTLTALAEKLNMTEAELRTRLGIAGAEVDMKDRHLAVETAVTRQRDSQAVAAGAPPPPTGGGAL